jgi:hypothetical protein
MKASDLFNERRRQRYALEPGDTVERITVTDFAYADGSLRIQCAKVKMIEHESPITHVFPYGVIWVLKEREL